MEVVCGVDEFEEGGLEGVGLEAEGLYLGVEAGGGGGEGWIWWVGFMGILTCGCR